MPTLINFYTFANTASRQWHNDLLITLLMTFHLFTDDYNQLFRSKLLIYMTRHTLNMKTLFQFLRMRKLKEK